MEVEQETLWPFIQSQIAWSPESTASRLSCASFSETCFSGALFRRQLTLVPLVPEGYLAHVVSLYAAGNRFTCDVSLRLRLKLYVQSSPAAGTPHITLTTVPAHTSPDMMNCSVSSSSFDSRSLN